MGFIGSGSGLAIECHLGLWNSGSLALAQILARPMNSGNLMQMLHEGISWIGEQLPCFLDSDWMASHKIIPQ